MTATLPVPDAVTILLVEDDEGFRETFADVLALKGARVWRARGGEEALVSLGRERPSVVVMDVQLPDMHGFELCRRVKALRPDVPVIFVSAASRYNDPRDRVDGLLAGAAQFLPKPVTVERLWGEIERALRGGPSAPPIS